jgi:L-threonylcarbamoyladenylate synthase
LPLSVIDSAAPDAALIEAAASLLRDGRLVAFPTETVYGLGANALDASAVGRIYAAKGRPAYNPIIVHVASIEGADAVVREWTAPARALAEAFWPGPITLVLPKRDVIPDAVSAGLPTVGVRVPRHPVAIALLNAARIPVAAPSANRSMQVSPTTGAHVLKSLGDAVDLILDAGPTPVGIESTVIDVSGATPTLLRPGTITRAELEAVVGPIALVTTAANAANGESARPSPGMLDRHYAPRARLVLVDAGDVGVRVEHERGNVQRAGAIVIAADVQPSTTILRLPHDARQYAARLYDALHTLDDMGCDAIIVERVPETPEWFGVRDRLARASR